MSKAKPASPADKLKKQALEEVDEKFDTKHNRHGRDEIIVSRRSLKQHYSTTIDKVINETIKALRVEEKSTNPEIIAGLIAKAAKISKISKKKEYYPYPWTWHVIKGFNHAAKAQRKQEKEFKGE